MSTRNSFFRTPLTILSRIGRLLHQGKEDIPQIGGLGLNAEGVDASLAEYPAIADDADLAADAIGLGEQVMAGDSGCAAAGGYNGGQAAQGGGFAGPVAPRGP